MMRAVIVSSPQVAVTVSADDLNDAVIPNREYCVAALDTQRMAITGEAFVFRRHKAELIRKNRDRNFGGTAVRYRRMKDCAAGCN